MDEGVGELTRVSREGTRIEKERTVVIESAQR